MKKGKVIFTGHFFDFFWKSIGLFLLCIVTLGILLPYFIYWQVKYFVNNLEIEIY